MFLKDSCYSSIPLGEKMFCPKKILANNCLWALLFYLKSIRNVPEPYLTGVVADFVVAVFAVKMSNLLATNS